MDMVKSIVLANLVTSTSRILTSNITTLATQLGYCLYYMFQFSQSFKK